MPLWFRIARLWLPVAVATTVVVLLVSVSVQQTYRMGANDPQIQLAEDGAAALDAGAVETDVVPAEKVNLASSLAPFVIVYDPKNAAIDGSGVLDGASPVPPSGVLAAARDTGRDAVTWQPRAGVRIASVSVAARDGRVVLAGRSLREVEVREDALSLMVGLAWIGAMLGSLLASVAVELVGQRWG